MGAESALLSAVSDEKIRQLLQAPAVIGSIDHFSDSTDLRSYIHWREKIRAFYSD
jgi:hypothetical protein